MRDALESFAHDLDSDDPDDPSDEQILDNIRAGFDTIKTGQTYPASEMMERLRARQGVISGAGLGFLNRMLDFCHSVDWILVVGCLALSPCACLFSGRSTQNSQLCT